MRILSILIGVIFLCTSCFLCQLSYQARTTNGTVLYSFLAFGTAFGALVFFLLSLIRRNKVENHQTSPAYSTYYLDNSHERNDRSSDNDEAFWERWNQNKEDRDREKQEREEQAYYDRLEEKERRKQEEMNDYYEKKEEERIQKLYDDDYERFRRKYGYDEDE